MKIKIITLLISLFYPVLTFSQQVGYKEITEKRIEYIACKLPLTSAEAEKFWPLFREFHAEREKMARNKKTNPREDVRPVSEEEFRIAINAMIESKIDQANLMKRYNEMYLKIIPAEKVFKLYQLDEEFNKFLLNQLKEQGRERRK